MYWKVLWLYKLFISNKTDPSPIIQQLLYTAVSNSDETYRKGYFIQYLKHNETSGFYCAKRYIERMMKQRVILFVANIGWFISSALQLNLCRPTKPFHQFALVHSFHKSLIFLIWSYLCFLFESHCQCHFVKEFKSKKVFKQTFQRYPTTKLISLSFIFFI